MNEDLYGNKKRFDFVSDIFFRRKPKKVLDFGCGTGRNLTLPLAERFPEIEILAVDEDVCSVKEGNGLVKTPNVSFGTEIPDQERYDIIIVSEVLEHVEQPFKLVHFLSGKLSDEGVLIVTVPNGYGAFELMNILRSMTILTLMFFKLISPQRTEKSKLMTLANSPHINFFSLKEITQGVEKIGFRVSQSKSRTLVCGFLFNVFRYIPGFIKFNAKIVDYLPLAFGSGWLMMFEKDSSRMDSKIVQYEQNFYKSIKKKMNLAESQYLQD